MKVLFILPDTNYVKEYMPDYSGSLHLGIAYLASYLMQHGHSCSLIHIKNERDIDDIGHKAQSSNPDLVAYTGFTHQFEIIRMASKEIKASTGALSICGGIHATIDPEDAIREPGIDIVCIGEGEDALLELAGRLENKKSIDDIGSLWIKRGGNIIKNPVRQLRQNLDDLPFPSRTLFDFENLSDTKLGVLNVIATRGCPYQCTYCVNHQLQKIYARKGRYIRFRSVDNIIKEISETYSKYPSLKYVELLDDTFCLDKDWVKTFCQEYERQIPIPFRANTRINLLNEDIINSLKKARCERVAVGIESGNPQIRKDLLKRFMSNEEIIKIIRLCRKAGIEVTTYNMIGIPFETLDNVLETVKLNVAAGPSAMHISIFQPYPNTALYDLCVDNKLITGKEVKTFFEGTTLKQKSISENEITFAYKYFRIFVRLYRLFGFYPIDKLLDKTFKAKSLNDALIRLHPLIFTLVFPVRGIYRSALKIFPRTMRHLRTAIAG